MIVRQAEVADAAGMAAVLNQIIAIGGTTAHQVAKAVPTVQADYVDGPTVLTSVVAVDQGRVIGWHSVGLWHGHADIGTFVQPGIQARRIGAALFARTCDLAKAKCVRTIHAATRADNAPGLAYYARIGFVDAGSEPDFALADGRVVGRVFRRFEVV